jgi:hypothetical protein
MKYATPKTVLTALASRGTSVTRTEALRLLASEIPDDWPECPRNTRAALLRRLACDQKKSAKARLAALKEVLAREPQASTAPERSADHAPTTSEVMLRALGKDHLGQVSEEDFARHSAEVTWPERLELDRQRGEWFCPDPEILVLLGLSRLTYWQGVRDRARTDDVRQNAQREIKRLESSDGN